MVRVVVRAPNHLGDFVMALPALYAANADCVLVPRWLAPLSNMAGLPTLAFDKTEKGGAARTGLPTAYTLVFDGFTPDDISGVASREDDGPPS